MTHEITAIDGDLGDLLRKHLQGNYRPDYVKVDGVVLSEVYKKFSEIICSIINYHIELLAFQDLPSIIRKTAKFLGKNLTTDQVSLLANHLSFENMKINPAVNREALVAFCQQLVTNKQNGTMMRNGTTDQWKLVMVPEIVDRFDDWSRENSKNTKLRL